MTKQHEMQSGLLSSGAPALVIFEVSPVAMAINDDHGKITHLNRAFVLKLGYTVSDIPALTDWWPRAYPDPEYRQWVSEEWQRHLEEAKRTNEPFVPLELNVRCKDESIRTFLIGAAALGESFFGSHLATLTDITERKRSELQLRNSERLFRTLAKVAPVGIFHTDAVGSCLYVNEGWCQIA